MNTMDELNKAMDVIGHDHFAWMCYQDKWTRHNIIMGSWFANDLVSYNAYKTLFND